MPKFDIFRNESDQPAYVSGETIFHAGQPGDFLYAVVEGEVEIRSKDKLLARLGAGEIFGEMALLDDNPRSASAIAATDCTLARVSRDRFLQMITATPFFAIQVMQVMAERLRHDIEF